MPPASIYYKDKVVLVGDAAHASTPFQGAGAGQGVEDVLILEKLLGKYLDPKLRSPAMPTAALTIPSILQAYDTIRRFRSQKVVTTSRETGRMITCLDPEAGDRAETMRKAMQGRQDWIWDFDQERSVKDAFQIFDEIRDAAERQMAQKEEEFCVAGGKKLKSKTKAKRSQHSKFELTYHSTIEFETSQPELTHLQSRTLR